jgi:GNAT superfamily N-acetyltransferase
MLTYRKVTKSDIEIIRNLACKIWTISYADMISAEQIEYMLEWMYSAKTIEKEINEGVIWELIELDNQSIGYISLTPEIKQLKLNKLYILPEIQGKGIGQEALKHVLHYGRENGFSSVYLTVNKRNHNAVKAYTKAGFKCTDYKEFDIGGGFIMDDYIYTYVL